MALELPYGGKNLNPNGSSSFDESYGYYNSLAEAYAAVPLAMRKGGRTVGIKQADGSIVEYWWENDNDLTNGGLVKKIAEPFDPTPLENAIQDLEDNKVDKDGDKQLSDENYTTAEKDKLAGLESSKFLGLYPSESALISAHPTASAGNYADVDAGTGIDTIRYVWDVSDGVFVQSGSGTPLTGAQIKQMYEAQPDTNAFTDSLKSWLQGMTEQFTTVLKNSYDNVVTWVSENGANVLSHINSAHAPTDAEKNRPFGTTAGTVMAGDDGRIVDGGVVRKSVLLVSEDNVDDIIIPGHYHTFQNDIATNFPTDYGGAMKVVTSGDGEIYQIVYSANSELLSRSYFQGEYSGWDRYAPVRWVNNNFAKLSDIYKENAVLDGDWFLKPNTEDTYNVIAREYIINKVLYTDTITGEVTREPRHATLRRWDMITVENDHTFLITSGVPALDPTRPIPNKQQAVLTYIFVSAIADAPPAPDFLLIYDENVGEPTEANVTTGAPSIVDLDSTEAPFQGTTHILFNERVADTDNEAVVFTFTTLQNLNHYGKLILHMATGYGGASNNQFLIHVKNGNTTIASFSSNAISWSPTGVSNWERGVLEILEYANLQNDEFDKIVIDASSGQGWDGYIQEDSKLDYIFLTEKDDTTPVNPVVIQRTSDIPINDGASGVSRYAEMGDIEKPDVILSANSVLRANWNGRDVITSHTITVNPNTQDYGDGFEVYLYNNSATDSAIVLNAKAGVTYTVIDNDVSSATVFLQGYGTAVIKRIGNTQNYIVRGYII